MTYILVYDRTKRTVLSLEEFTEDQQQPADESRRLLEQRFRQSTNVEVVTLISDNQETLRLTHGRYFLTDEEIVAAIDHRVA